MTEDEKRGFEHGFRVMLKMVEEGGFIFEKAENIALPMLFSDLSTGPSVTWKGSRSSTQSMDMMLLCRR